ncbi:MAG: hypothetical protein AAF985_04855 [Bacteroidota bacterium]
MKNSSLTQLLAALSKKEHRALGKWLRSPFFNQRKDVIQLYDYFNQVGQVADQSLDKPSVFAHLFPGESYNDSKLRHTMSFLLRQIKHFLAYQKWQSRPCESTIAEVEAMRQYDQETLFYKTVDTVNKHLEQSQDLTHLHHFYHYQVHLEQYRISLKKSRIKAMNLQQVSDALTTFYVAETLRVSCLMIAHQSVTTQEYRPQMLSEVLEKSRQAPFCDLPEVAIYYYAYGALSRPEAAVYFDRLKQLITTHWQRFALDEMRDIYLLAINYCIKKLNSGEKHFIGQALDLYKIGLEKSILLENGILSRFTYNNVLTLSLMSNDFAWARSFLETYQAYLPTDSRRNTYLYNLTIYHFKKQEYLKVMELLQQVQFRDVLYNLDTRRMLLRSYFEIGAFDALDSLLDSFMVFIRRRRDLGYHKENFKNLIKFTKKLLAIEHQKQALIQLQDAVEQTSAVADKEWLIEKIRGKIAGVRPNENVR